MGLPVCAWLCQKFERHRAGAVSLLITTLWSGLPEGKPAGPTALYPILLIYPIGLIANICITVAFRAMIGGVVNYERLRTGEDGAGIFSAINAFLTKTMVTVSGAFGIAMVGWFGFDATAPEQTVCAGFGIRPAAAGLPALGFAASIPILGRFPITPARQT